MDKIMQLFFAFFSMVSRDLPSVWHLYNLMAEVGNIIVTFTIIT